MFPRVLCELHQLRVAAATIPDPLLRGMALEALRLKRGNLEGAAAFAALVPRASRPLVVRALSCCQAMCDYLDLLSEQPCVDPVANGYRLHEALIVATASGEPHRDYYAHHNHQEDGGYLRRLIDVVRSAISALPSVASIGEPIERAAERIAVYQSFNHGDARGSYAPFDQWASEATALHPGLRPWETAAGAGSTLAVFALIASAAEPALSSTMAADIDEAYFPWIGSLHSLLDSLVDREEDIAVEGRALVDYYDSPIEAAVRMRTITNEALRRASGLPQGRRHALIVAAMTSFYLCELRRSRSAHAQAIAPGVRDALGGLATPTMTVFGTRHKLQSIAQSSARALLPAQV